MVAWLATGALSPRQAYAELRQFEATRGATESSYWLWFELLWRDYFRFLHMQHGRALYRARGLGPSWPRRMMIRTLQPGAQGRPARR
jgi:deoxyribodipyrimidine photo-lyase